MTPTLNESELLGAERIRMDTQMRFDPLPDLTPERLLSYHQAFARGYLRSAVMTWDRISESDSRVLSVRPKREKAVSRHGYEFIFSDGVDGDDPRAMRHKDALEYFYGNIVAVNAVEPDERGGMRMLIRQMMTALGNVYAAHHIVWEPRPEGLTAELHHVPLRFFERTSGRLRFLRRDYDVEGEDLEPGSWMVTRGTGIMAATAIAYMYKRLPMRDWLIYSMRHGAPKLHGETAAQKGSEEWNDLANALLNFGIDLAMVTGPGNKINTIDTSATGELPYPKLVDYMDREIASLWRGGDLSTMSNANAVGAEMQAEEKDLLEEDDAEMVTDALNEYIDRRVIQNIFGEEPLAWIRIKTPTKEDITQDIEIDRFVVTELGLPQSQEQLAARYNRTLPEPDETILDRRTVSTPPATPAANALRSADPVASPPDRGAERLLAEARLFIAQAEQRVLEPLIAPLIAIYNAAADGEDLAVRLAAFQEGTLPGLLEAMNAAPETAQALAEAMAAAFVNGIEEASS